MPLSHLAIAYFTENSLSVTPLIKSPCLARKSYWKHSTLQDFSHNPNFDLPSTPKPLILTVCCWGTEGSSPYVYISALFSHAPYFIYQVPRGSEENMPHAHYINTSKHESCTRRQCPTIKSYK